MHEKYKNNKTIRYYYADNKKLKSVSGQDDKLWHGSNIYSKLEVGIKDIDFSINADNRILLNNKTFKFSDDVNTRINKIMNLGIITEHVESPLENNIIEEGFSYEYFPSTPSTPSTIIPPLCSNLFYKNKTTF